MSLSTCKDYLRRVGTKLGLREWRDGFNFENIPSNLIDKAFHIQPGQVVGLKNNQYDQELNVPMVVRIFSKGFRDVSAGIDSAMDFAGEYVSECIEPANRTAPGMFIKNVVFENATFDAESASNDNLVVTTLNFRFLVIIE